MNCGSRNCVLETVCVYEMLLSSLDIGHVPQANGRRPFRDPSAATERHTGGSIQVSSSVWNYCAKWWQWRVSHCMMADGVTGVTSPKWQSKWRPPLCLGGQSLVLCSARTMMTTKKRHFGCWWDIRHLTEWRPFNNDIKNWIEMNECKRKEMNATICI